MSRHQAVRNMDYQDELDDYEGYSEEEDELSPEDRAAMEQGKAAVQAALASSASKVTTSQIEEALWHYYYDVDKTVAYLISKFIDPPKKTPKAVTESNGEPLISFSLFPSGENPSSPSLVLGKTFPTADIRIFHLLPSLYAQASLTPCQGLEYVRHSSTLGNTSGSRASLSHDFRDMPWGNIPKHREAILIPPRQLRGGLLGGSSKMSKLQQLAAARKKKAEEKEAQERVEQTRSQMQDLSVGKPATQENSPLAGAFGKRLKTSESTAKGRNPLEGGEPTRHGTTEQPLADTTNKQGVMEVDLVQEPPLTGAGPSPFAQTLFGPPSDSPKRKILEFFPLPYTEIAPAALDVFSNPSPDDVVLTAQSKGWLLGRAVANANN
jgi:elongation factor 1 alpha-like protein